METMARETWTDERLDDLKGSVDRLDQRMENGFAEVRAEIAGVKHSIQQLAIGVMGTMLVGFLGVIATVLTQS